MFKDTKYLLQIEEICENKFVVLFNNKLSLFQINADTELSVEFSSNSFTQESQSGKFHIVQKFTQDKGNTLHAELIVMLHSKLFHFVLLTEMDDGQPNYFFSVQRELLVCHPILDFSLLTNFHIVVQSEGFIQAACFSLSSTLNPNVFEPVDNISGSICLLPTKQNLFIVSTRTIEKAKILKDWQVATEAIKRGKLAEGMAMAARWLRGEEGRLISSNENEEGPVQGERRTKIVDKIIEEAFQHINEWDENDERTQDNSIGLRCLIDFFDLLNELHLHFPRLQHSCKAKGAEKLLYHEMIALISEGIITALDDSVLAYVVNFLASSDQPEDKANLENTILKLDFSKNSRDFTTSIFYEKSLYACFLKVLMTQQPPDYFTGLSMLISRIIRMNLDHTSQECQLVLALLFSAYCIDGSEFDFKTFDNIGATIPLEKWILSEEIIRCLLLAYPLPTILLITRIYSTKTPEERAFVEQLIRKTVEDLIGTISSETTNLDLLNAASSYFCLLSHLDYDLTLSKKQVLAHLVTVGSSSLIDSNRLEALILDIFRKHSCFLTYSQLNSILEISTAHSCQASSIVANILMSKPIKIDASNIDKLCSNASIAKSICGDISVLLESILASFEEIVTYGGVEQGEVSRRVDRLMKDVFLDNENKILESASIRGEIMIDVMESVYGKHRMDRLFTSKLFSLYCTHRPEKTLMFCRLHLVPIDESLEIAKKNNCEEAFIYLLFRNGQFEQLIEEIANYCQKYELYNVDEELHSHERLTFFKRILELTLSPENLKHQEEEIVLLASKKLLPFYYKIPKFIENLLFPILLEFLPSSMLELLADSCAEAALFWSIEETSFYWNASNSTSMDDGALGQTHLKMKRTGKRYDYCSAMDELEMLELKSTRVKKGKNILFNLAEDYLTESTELWDELKISGY